MTQRQILMKHSMSAARDAMVSCEVEESTQTIVIRMDFIAVAHLQRFLSWVMPTERGIEPWFSDDPVQQQGRALWRILLIVDEHRYRVRLFKQLSLVPKQDQWALELHEVK